MQMKLKMKKIYHNYIEFHLIYFFYDKLYIQKSDEKISKISNGEDNEESDDNLLDSKNNEEKVILAMTMTMKY